LALLNPGSHYAHREFRDLTQDRLTNVNCSPLF
jgi:hypothetical protein